MNGGIKGCRIDSKEIKKMKEKRRTISKKREEGLVGDLRRSSQSKVY